MLSAFLDKLGDGLHEVEKLLCMNKIFIDRCEDVGYLSKEELISLGITGPLLRAAGVPRDLRRDNPYLVYSEFDFDVITFSESDVLARFYVRLNEIKQSERILRQALEKIPQGPIHAQEAKKVLPKKERINLGVDPPVGEVYQGIESSKGEFGLYIVSDGTGHPWRMKIHSPSMVNLSGLAPMVKGAMISDIVAVIGSIDPVMGEADK
jgi:NADH-quinone oxidoreductase subunit D